MKKHRQKIAKGNEEKETRVDLIEVQQIETKREESESKVEERRLQRSRRQ